MTAQPLPALTSRDPSAWDQARYAFLVGEGQPLRLQAHGGVLQPHALAILRGTQLDARPGEASRRRRCSRHVKAETTGTGDLGLEP